MHARTTTWLATDRASPAFKRRTLVLLFAATLLPRFVMAWLIPTICPDGTTYVAVAKWIEEQGTCYRRDLGVNLYPLILAALHKTGLGWPLAAKLWGVVCASLAVLPLYGWVRRMFDDRIALYAGLLYAFHSKLIEWSPEMVREQTFWLLAALVWYAAWRAAHEGRVVWFAALAALLPAAVLTRFEGLFLYVIPLAWSLAAAINVPERRRRLLTLTTASLAAAPAAGLLYHFVRNGASIEQFAYSLPWERARELLARVSGSGPSVVNEHFGARPNPLSPAIAQMVGQTVVRGFTPLYALLLLVGLVVEGRRTFSVDRLPVLSVTLLTLAGIWTHAWYAGLISSRYLLPLVIASSGTAAVGFLTTVRSLSNFAAKRRPALHPAWAAAAITTVVILAGCIDAFKTNYAGRLETARLGTWIRAQYGSGLRIYGGDAQLELLAYYAEADCFRIPPYRTPEVAATHAQDIRPDIILLSAPLPAETRRSLQDFAAKWGYTTTLGPCTYRPVEILSSAESRTTSRR